MSGIQNQISDQTNQAIALLGGATAQSYSAVGLNTSPAALGLQNVGASLHFSDLIDVSARNNAESTSQSLERLFIDPSIPVVTSQPVSSSTAEELSELPNSYVQPVIQNPELISRFEDSSLDDEGVFGAQQTGFPGGSLIADESPEILANGGLGFSLLDFIEQAIAQSETSQQEFGDTLDGSHQNEFREFLMDTGMELLDPIAEPLLGVDYYAKSAEVLNGLMDAVAQPIGSIALPQVGPLLADPREELSAYLG